MLNLTSLIEPSTLTNVGRGVLVSIGALAGSGPELVASEHALAPFYSSSRPWERTGVVTAIDSNNYSAIPTEFLMAFAGRMVAETVDPDPEFDAFVMERFWELV